jgi:predicted N-acetyltransferase YhbS
MNLNLRPETGRDHEAVEFLTRESFWDVYRPGCVEHLVAHKLRQSPAFIPELDFVAELGGRLAGNIMYSRAEVVGGGSAAEVLTFGPLSVLPEFQKNGVGAALILHTKKLAGKMGFKAIIIFGNPAYYRRFGFVGADKFGISTADGANFDAFMALELYPGALRGVAGKYRDDPAFQIDPGELEEFDQKFPFRKKHVTDTQLK